MRALLSKRRLAARFGAWFALAWAWGAIGNTTGAGSGESPMPAERSEGLRLFLTDWSSASRPGFEGDGLGPMFNDSSCVACHNLGGPGGGGPNSKNVDILTGAFNIIRSPPARWAGT